MKPQANKISIQKNILLIVVASRGKAEKDALGIHALFKEASAGATKNSLWIFQA